MPKRGQSTYNLLLKQFTKINNKLPEDRKLSIKARRQIIKESLLPKYKDTPKYKIRLKKVKSDILRIYDKLPPKEICDLNYIDPSLYAVIEWFSLDETITDLIPDCVYVKVSAGSYGETNIFNTRNYQYGRTKVRAIVEAIRPDANNNSGKFIFSGVKKLRPRRLNNGTPENYYLDLILFITDKNGIEQPQADDIEAEYTLPQNRETKSKTNKVRKVIEQKIKKLKSKKDSRRRSKKTLKKNIDQLVQASKKYDKLKEKGTAATFDAYRVKIKSYIKTKGIVKKYYEKGLITKKQYQDELSKIEKNFKS